MNSGLFQEAINEFIPLPAHQLKSSAGLSLYEHSKVQPVFLIFLRHFGCTFCKQLLDFISTFQDEIHKFGLQTVFVHMSDFESGNINMTKYSLKNAVHIPDPERQLYKSFDIIKGKFNQVFGLSLVPKFLKSVFIQGYANSAPEGDVMQLSAYFIYENGKVIKKYQTKDATDIPDILDFLNYKSTTTP